MTIMWGKVHKYLGMTIDHSSPGKVILWMIDYIGKMIDYIPSDMKGESSKPTAHQLFYIVQDLTKLYQADADLFYHFVAQLLYILKRARPYMKLAVSLLSTRVRGTDINDCNNLERAIKYMQGTIGLPLILANQQVKKHKVVC